MSTHDSSSNASRSAWLETLPADWSQVNLRWLARLYAGGTPDKSKEEYWADGTIPWLNSGTVNQGLVTEASAYISQAGFDGSSARWVPKGALVMALAGQGKTKGMVAQTGIEATCNQSMAAIVPHGIDARFLFYWLTANYRRIRSGASDDLRDGLNLQMLGDIPCPVPRSRHEQQRIANFLDEQTARIDALIAEKTALLDKLDEFRLSSIYQCISQGLTGSATVDTGDDWFPTLPVGWAFCALNYRYEVQLGKMLDEKRLTGEHATPYLRNIDVRWGYVNTDNLPLMDIAPQERDRYTLRAGDLLVCEGGVGVGRTAIWGGSQEVVGYQKALHRVRPRSSRDVPKFLYYQMQDAVWRDRVLGQEKATIPHLTAEAFRRWRLPFPPVADQRAIVAHLDALSERTSTLANHCSLHIDRLREYRSSLISAAVTGQLELGTFKEAA